MNNRQAGSNPDAPNWLSRVGNALTSRRARAGLSLAGAALAIGPTAGCTPAEAPHPQTISAAPEASPTPTPVQTTEITPSATDPSPEASETTTTTPSSSASETAPATEAIAIQKALEFVKQPLSERDVVFIDAATEALNATDRIYMEVAFSERVGATGNILAVYNPEYRPGTVDDSAEKVLGQQLFGVQLANNQELQGEPGALDVPEALRVLSGTYYAPTRSLDFKFESGQRANTFGILNETTVGRKSGLNELADIAFDPALQRQLEAIGSITDDSGEQLPVRVSKYHAFQGAETYRVLVSVLRNGRWICVDEVNDENWQIAVTLYTELVNQ